MTQIKLLIVEDREENVNAAKQYFSSMPNVEVEFASDYEQGLEKLMKGFYAGAILDVELPKKAGMEPEKLGYDLAQKAMECKTPHVLLTGYFHHGDISKVLLEDDNCCLKSGPVKSNPAAWEIAYIELSKIAPLEMIQKAKDRHAKVKKYLQES